MKKLLSILALCFIAENSSRLCAEPPQQIASAVERGSYIYVYNDKGNQICAISGGGSGPKDGLQGYTGSTVSVRRGSYIYVYNAKGNQISAISAGN